MQTQDFIALENEYGAHNYHPLDVVIERAEGVWVYDVEGKKYLDCLAAYSAVNQGHCHPDIMQAMLEQAHKVTLTSRAFRNDQLPLLYKELHDLTGFDMALPMNSGAEAVETAIKTARKWGYKVKGIPEGQAEIIVCSNNFHGRTITIVSFSTDEQYRDGFGPFTPGFKIVPYGDAEARRATPSRRTPARSSSSRSRARPASSCRPPASCARRAEVCREEQRAVHGRRDPVGPRPDRQAVRLPCTRASRPDVLIIGKALVGRLLPRLGRALLEGGPRRVQAGRSRQHLRRQPAGLRGRARLAPGARRREAGRALGGAGRSTSWSGCAPSRSPHVQEVRGLGLWIGIELTGRGPALLRGAQGGRASSARRRTSTSSVSPRRSSSRKDEIDWAVERIEKVVR